MAFDKITAVRSAGRPWLDAFAFTDVTNYGQTTHPLDGLLPGVQYAFIVGSVNSRFGTAVWSEWVYLTTAEAATQCPAGAGNPPEPEPGATPRPAPTATPGPTPDPEATPTPAPTLTPTPVPVGTDYDRNDNGLIEITSLAQLDAIRHDLDGDGVSAHTAGYAEAFPDAAPGMGCFRRQCRGYELVANLDFDTNGNGQIDEGDAYWDEGNGWYPIGEVKYPFNTLLDGNGHTIANLYIFWDRSNIGLFAALGEDAEVRNLNFTGVDISGGAEKTGALAGFSGGRIANIRVSGEVTGGGEVGGLVGQSSGTISESNSSTTTTGTGNSVGGLVGHNTGTITDSYATGNVTGGGENVGGLTGRGGNITASYATGKVTGESGNVGGLVGSGWNITDSHATGSVTGESGNVGGLTGWGGNITASYATGNVTGASSVGGLVGSGGNITASYATGNVTGESGYVGGLAGTCSSCSITASYATGSVTSRGSTGGLVGYGNSATIIDRYAVGSVTGDNTAGGLVGYCYYPRTSSYWCRTTSSYWDTQTTGQARSGSGAGKTTREMQRPTGPTGIYAEWDPEYWDFGTSRQYPVLKYDGMDVGAQR